MALTLKHVYTLVHTSLSVPFVLECSWEMQLSVREKLSAKSIHSNQVRTYELSLMLFYLLHHPGSLFISAIVIIVILSKRNEEGSD